MSTPVGIILPPADIRKIVDKTAEFVAKNGQSFEELVIKAESNNQKFSFLKKEDPYRPYYESQVSYFSKQQSLPSSSTPQQQQALIQSNILQKAPDMISKYEGPHIQPLSFLTEFSGSRRELRPPQPDVFSVPTPKNLTALEVDIMKHTAQFVALHGQKFLMEITEREKNNAQFDFVKPNNIYFTFFTQLIDAYSRCIQPKKEDIIKLQQFSYDRNNILQRCFDRFEFENTQEQSQMIQERLDQEERYQMEQIDWNDFVIVETIELFDNEDLPAPEKQKEFEIPQKLEENAQIIGVASKPNLNEPEKLIMPALPEKPKEEIQQPQQIEQKRKVEVPQGKETIKCHVCNQQIPINEFTQHLKIELLDPKYRDQKSQVDQTQVRQNNSQQFESSLKQFAQKRRDIFGEVEESQQFTKKDSCQLFYIDNFQVPQDQQESQDPEIEDNDSQFIPEAIWLKSHPGQISLFVRVPDEGGEETWKLNGQILQLQFDPKSTIAQIKAELSSILAMPSSKEKLRMQKIILKDNHTLAYYNVMNSSSIELVVKERGGRQK